MNTLCSACGVQPAGILDRGVMWCRGCHPVVGKRLATVMAESNQPQWVCPNSDEIQMCPRCFEWTGICQPCCNSGIECDQCDGDGNPVQEESA